MDRIDPAPGMGGTRSRGQCPMGAPTHFFPPPPHPQQKIQCGWCGGGMCAKIPHFYHFSTWTHFASPQLAALIRKLPGRLLGVNKTGEQWVNYAENAAGEAALRDL